MNKIISQLAAVLIKLSLALILLLTISSANASTTHTSNRLTSATGGEAGTYSYNANGSMTGLTQGVAAYTLAYDWMHNTTSYKAGTTTLAAFTYDGDGTRVTKTGNGTTTVYHTDKEGKTITETDISGNLIANYIYVNGKLAAKKESTSLFFYHTDPAGTPLALTNSAGAIAWKADYKPFGEEQLTAATKDNYKMFVGKEKDKETGLYYFGARYMQDKTARFVSVDPVGPVDERSGKVNEKMLLNPQRLNRYAYSLNNPYRFYDPDGKFAFVLAPLAIPALEALGVSVLGLTTFKVIEQAYKNYREGMYNEGSADGDRSSGNDSSSGNKNPFNGPVDKPVTIVNPSGNAVPVGTGEQATGSPDGKWVQVRDKNGKPTGKRLDGPHNPATHSDPRAQKPHAHVPEKRNPDGTEWLPAK